MHHPSPSTRSPLTHPARLFATALMALGLALPAWSQSSSAPGRSATSQGNPSAPQNTREERELVEDLAHANLAEIETGRLALEKTQNTQVRQFAQQTVDEHTKALQELQQLAQKKQLKVPEEADFQHKAIATAMRLLSGETFDRQYIRQIAVRDHRRAEDLLQKAQRSQDSDIKAYASRLLPVVQRHLAMARDLEQQMK